MTPHFWRGKRVLVTGHTGFKGAWLSELLLGLDAEVNGFALEPATTPSLFELLRLRDRMNSRIGDVRDRAALDVALREAAPSVVFHLAAQALVRQGYADPVATFETNVMGTVHVLEALRNVPSVEAVVVVTSDKCYQNREWVWGYRESDALGGDEPYSASKGAAEIVTHAYRASFLHERVGVASARAGNVIGGGDWSHDRLIPDLVQAVLSGRPPELRSPHAIRPWQHVLEPLGGYLRLAEHLVAARERFAGAWNFGPGVGDALTVETLARAFLAELGSHVDLRPQPGEHPRETSLLRVDSSKANQVLGWLPRLDPAEAIARTARWYRAHREGADMIAFTQSQIQEYFS
ncbi:MAG: CDP-glucose 4,6-dehydratase [bacterium]|nr:CDP-glucose 4,6-dehydratase [bacterium]